MAKFPAKSSQNIPAALPDEIKGQLYQWLVIILLIGLLPGIDNAAHMGGLVTGFIFGYLLLPQRMRKANPRMDSIWALVAVVGLVVTLISFGCATMYALDSQNVGDVQSILLRRP